MMGDIGVTKGMVIDAICGVGFDSIEAAENAEFNGYAISVGTKDQPRWVWNRDKLDGHSLEDLAALYLEIKNAR